MPSSQKLQILLKPNCTWMFIGWSSTILRFFGTDRLDLTIIKLVTSIFRTRTLKSSNQNIVFIGYDVLIGCFLARVRNSNSTVLWPITPQPDFELSVFESAGFKCNYPSCITSVDVILRSCHNHNICCNSKQHFQFSCNMIQDSNYNA
jgi:hypothetical protein